MSNFSTSNFPSKHAKFGTASYVLFQADLTYYGFKAKGKVFSVDYGQWCTDTETIRKDCEKYGGFAPAKIGSRCGDFICFELAEDWKAWKSNL